MTDQDKVSEETAVEERREFTRVPIQMDVEVKSEGGRIQGHSANLSLKGLFVVGGEDLPEGAPCRVTLHLCGTPSERIEIEGCIAHREEGGCGIEVTAIHGLRSLDHFKQLLLHNSPRAAQIEEEFDEHIGIHRLP